MLFFPTRDDRRFVLEQELCFRQAKNKAKYRRFLQFCVEPFPNKELPEIIYIAFMLATFALPLKTTCSSARLWPILLRSSIRRCICTPEDRT
jgi:hypothetical protein